ncbi:MAG: GTPase HflX [Ilumatobacteraceae bacterium]
MARPASRSTDGASCDRIARLERDLVTLAETRDLQRRQRARSGLTDVSIVGYTNAGKSSLLNTLTESGVLTEDRLFATLDPTARRLDLPGGEPVLLTDTVGFVRRLPHGLVEAFKSTLEVAARADHLVHVVDASAPDPEGQIAAVHTVLSEIGAASVPQLVVFNKIDVAPDEAERLLMSHPGSVAISAVTGEGVDELLVTLADLLRRETRLYDLVVPYARGDVLASVHREGEILSNDSLEDGMHLSARLSEASSGTRWRSSCVATSRPAAGTHLFAVRASERQRASGYRRPAWPGNAMTDGVTSCARCERGSASERAVTDAAWRGRGTQ